MRDGASLQPRDDGGVSRSGVTQRRFCCNPKKGRKLNRTPMDAFGAGPEPFENEPVAEIRAGLARVLASDAFRAAPQLSAFLSFIVERAVAGRSGELKGYTIAVEAFGRSPDFDPQSDPIVRVEAGRLRRALAQYYAGEGVADRLRITIPVGAYVPAFERVERPVAEAGEPAQGFVAPSTLPPGGPSVPLSAEDIPPGRGLARRWSLAAGLSLGLALLSLAAWHGGVLGPAAETPVAAAPSVGAVLASASREVPLASLGKPVPEPLDTTVLVISVADLPDAELAAASRRFTNFLVDALSRFDDLVTVKVPAPGQPLPAEADYVLEMSAHNVAGGTEGFGRLKAVPDGRIIWSASSTRTLSANDEALPDNARRLATRLAEPFGIIHADIRQNRPAGPMRCIYEAIDVRRTMAAADHLAARNCLQDLIRRDPTFYPAWIQLAQLTLFEQSFGFNPLPEPPLERALTAALTAVRLAPSSARAQQALMTTLFKRGAIDEGLAAGRLAMSRNPYDPDIMAMLGARYIQLNRPAEGLPLLEKAIALSAGRPASYDFFALLGAHLLGARQVARAHGEFLSAGSNPFALLGRAIRAIQTGDGAERTRALQELCERYPAFHSEPRLWLMRRGFGADVTDRLLADLGVTRH